jgi:carbon-monoxide dehydrogenase large subunit
MTATLQPMDTIMSAIGQPLRRKEDARLLIGKGLFTDDFSMEGEAFAAMIRSPHPHARIVHVNMAPARFMPGVLAVFSGADCLADGLGPPPHSPVPSTKYDMKLTAPGGGKVFIGPHLLLPADKTRHVGEALAMVVANGDGAGARCRGSRRDRIRSPSLGYQFTGDTGSSSERPSVRRC